MHHIDAGEAGPDHDHIEIALHEFWIPGNDDIRTSDPI
jgi:hypothetical protein